MRESTFHWFAIQAKPANETIVETALQSLQLETLLPRVRTPNRGGRRSHRLKRRPLFQGYLFARFRPDLSLRAVIYCRGVTRVVGAKERPLPIEDAIIGSIRERMDDHGCVLLDAPALVAGDTVQVFSGPFGGWHGVFERDLSDGQRVVILLETLQHSRLVVDRDVVERTPNP